MSSLSAQFFLCHIYVLIRKFLSIDGLAPCSIVVGKAYLCVFAMHSHSPLPRCLLSHSLTERTDGLKHS
uniref:Uncharacterized protein n=1 Tax=Neolamprologus brichardi TaxID=32507 RepID=A0A3Q4GAN6_NEOBR